MTDMTMRARTRFCGAVAALVLNGGRAFGQGLTPPKVPFNNTPCESLTAADLAAMKVPTPVETKPFRAPAKLPFDNVCSYTHGGTLYGQVGYQTKDDYDVNSSSNRSKTRQAPSDLPGAFYDAQGGLWFAKNGYYVVIAGRSAMREPAARVIVKKL